MLIIYAHMDLFQPPLVIMLVWVWSSDEACTLFILQATKAGQRSEDKARIKGGHSDSSHQLQLTPSEQPTTPRYTAESAVAN